MILLLCAALAIAAAIALMMGKGKGRRRATPARGDSSDSDGIIEITVGPNSNRPSQHSKKRVVGARGGSQTTRQQARVAANVAQPSEPADYQRAYQRDLLAARAVAEVLLELTPETCAGQACFIVAASAENDAGCYEGLKVSLLTALTCMSLSLAHHMCRPAGVTARTMSIVFHCCSRTGKEFCASAIVAKWPQPGLFWMEWIPLTLSLSTCRAASRFASTLWPSKGSKMQNTSLMKPLLIVLNSAELGMFYSSALTVQYHSSKFPHQVNLFCLSTLTIFIHQNRIESLSIPRNKQLQNVSSSHVANVRLIHIKNAHTFKSFGNFRRA